MLTFLLSRAAGAYHHSAELQYRRDTTIIGRCITLARVRYYNSVGRFISDKTKFVRTAILGDRAYPGAKLIFTLPVTPKPI